MLHQLLGWLVMDPEPLLEYISRLTTRTIAWDQVVPLTSGQQGALRSWLRNNWPDFGAQARVQSRVSVKMLMAGRATPIHGAPSPSKRHPELMQSVEPNGTVSRVGVDIENASTLPEAEDYRIHPFFVENFSLSEIVHCLERDNPRLSFTGLWAAKEAISKACGIETGLGSLSRIEIVHDNYGRPMSEFGSVSISHSGEIAVAVCIANKVGALKVRSRDMQGVETAESQIPGATKMLWGSGRAFPVVSWLLWL